MSRTKRRHKKKVLLDTLVKVLATAIIIHGMVLTTLSYILSFFGRETVENVSVAIITEIIAPFAVYACTKTIENIFEKNKLTFSTPINQETENAEEEQ